MSRVDVVRAFFHALEEGDATLAERLCVDGQPAVEGPSHLVLSIPEFIAASTGLAAAMDDLRFELSDVQDAGGVVTATVLISGTHMRPLVVPIAGLPVMQPSGSRLELPAQQIVVTLQLGKIRAVSATDPDAPGILGLIRAVGLDMSPSGLMG